MNKIKYLLCMIVTFLFGISVVLAESSNFDTVISMEPDITENQVKLVLGFTGEESMIINQTLTYNNKYLKLVDVVAMDNFNVTTSKEKDDGKYSTIKILADSDYSFNESNYCIVIFEVNSKFKTRKKSDVFLYNVEATGPDKDKYRVKGDIITMDRESLSIMNMIVERIDDSTKVRYWFINHALILVIIAIVIIGAIVAFVLFFPSKRKTEKRDKEVSEQIKPDNYNPNNAFQIDTNAIDKIGVVEKNVDMSEAIIYDESVKPFGEIMGKPEENTSIKQNTDINPNMNANVFDSRTPDMLIVAEGNLVSVNIQQDNETPVEVQAPVEQVPQSSNSTEVNGFDPFNAKVELSTPTLDNNDDVVETLVDDNKLTNESVPSQNEGLISINTQAIESIEPISVESMPEFPISNVNSQETQNIAQTPIEAPVSPVNNVNTQETQNIAQVPAEAPVSPVNNVNTQETQNIAQVPAGTPVSPVNNVNNQGNNNPINFMIFVFLLVLSSFCLMDSVKAAEKEYRVTELRDSIVSRAPYNKELDYNEDGRIDIIDLVVTKNLVNCNFEDLMNTDPGFAERHGKSNNLISTDPNRPTTTKKGKKITTKRTKKSTTKKTKKSTTPTTKKSTTMRTKKSTTPKTTKSTTTRTRKTTTAKTEAPTYNISIKANNGTVNPANITLQKGKSTSVSLAANEGYTIKKENISCNNVSFSLSNSKKLVLSKPTADATCTVNFVGSSKIKISIKYVFGKGDSKISPSVKYGSYSSKSLTGTLGSVLVSSFTDTTGYKVANGYPTCGNYVSGAFTMIIPPKNTICELKFEPILYNVSINGGSPLTSSDSKIYFNESKKISYTSSTKYLKANCGGKIVSVTNRTQPDGTYKGSFTYKNVSASNVSCTLTS